MGISEGIRYAVATWGWEDSGKNTLLLSSTDGFQWRMIALIPCAHIMGMTLADGGAYLMGGQYGKRGVVIFVKF
jgi:hypothetical protein